MTKAGNRSPNVVDESRPNGELGNSDRPDLDHEAENGESPANLTRHARALAWVHSHPLIVVALVAALIGLGHAIWIWTHRYRGAYDPDESGYIANALRYQRTLDPLRPIEFIREVATTGTGPVVPLLGVPLLLLGPRDPRTVMMVQPFLLVLSAVAVGGIARRIAGPWSAIVSGLIWATIPTVALATGSFWLGLGASTSAALALWALFESNRLTNRWTYAYGICIALMMMSRTMALGFVPALAISGIVIAGRERQSWWGLTKAGILTIAVAGPWWAINWSSLTEYLFSYGYGERAGLFGSGTVVDRFWFRVERITDGIGLMWPILILLELGLLSSLISVVRQWRQNATLPSQLRNGIAVGAAVLTGMAVLTSTTNNGVWFELPVVVLLVPLVVGAFARAWLPLRVIALIAFAFTGSWSIARALWLVGPGDQLKPDSAHYEYGFAQYDPRFAPDRRQQLPAAAADWRRVNEEIVAELSQMVGAGRPIPVTVTGNMVLVNSNSIALAAELAGQDVRAEIPDTVRDTKRATLSPFTYTRNGEKVERLIVAGLHDKILFTPDAEVRRYIQDARAQGWRTAATVEFPGRGRVEILRHRN